MPRGRGGGRMTCGDGGVTVYVYIICSNLKSLNKQQAVLFHSAPDASPFVASAQTWNWNWFTSQLPVPPQCIRKILSRGVLDLRVILHCDKNAVAVQLLSSEIESWNWIWGAGLKHPQMCKEVCLNIWALVIHEWWNVCQSEPLTVVYRPVHSGSGGGKQQTPIL